VTFETDGAALDGVPEQVGRADEAGDELGLRPIVEVARGAELRAAAPLRYYFGLAAKLQRFSGDLSAACHSA
jgi:hypothetical protein